MENVGINMLEVSPTVVICVPRFFEKMHSKVIEQLNKASSARKKIFYWALKIGKDFVNLKIANQNISFLIANHQI